MMLSAEIAALRRMGPAPDFAGRRIAYSHGYDGDDLLPSTAAHYLFEIQQDGAELVCSIDIYSALGFPGEGEFDVDDWEAAMIRLAGMANRANYHALQSAARAILKGYRVMLPSGQLVHVEALYGSSAGVKS